MNIIKTLPAIQEELKYRDEVTINVKNETFSRGFNLGDNSYSGTISITEIFTELNVTEQDAVKKFIKIGTYKSGNIGIDPDTPLIITDIEDELT